MGEPVLLVPESPLNFIKYAEVVLRTEGIMIAPDENFTTWNFCNFSKTLHRKRHVPEAVQDVSLSDDLQAPSEDIVVMNVWIRKLRPKLRYILMTEVPVACYIYVGHCISHIQYSSIYWPRYYLWGVCNAGIVIS